MVNPYAYYDCLSVTTKLQKALDSVAEAELHLFTYLACLLTLYKNQPASDWEYFYTSTRTGSPFSPAMADAVPHLETTGLLRRANNRYFQITDSGRDEYESLRVLTENSRREIFLEGACSSVLALPVGIVREAVLHEPELHRATKLTSTRALLDGPGLGILYEQFSVLSAAVGVEVKSLMVPSVVWLTYLARFSKSFEPAFPEATSTQG